ncbi:hypothetical protein I3843_05G125700 [Carya illinoinensis]|uniref:Uncharacterized protein n=1 Tax=Carya illinoinensis TaxID=32201 RepID=A0A922F4K2_CARIL|nr:hypothetical protein I3760_05G137600 [Carya illinoinensis]KAG6713087.1 hypothetical protein I3842_05G133200 [Carya illinoinensis]KAG7979331.1 hypothetical protein I3843_05G125700 [Carya illinoinensis]
MAEWSKAPDSSSGPRERAWVQIPLLTDHFNFFDCFGNNSPSPIFYLDFYLQVQAQIRSKNCDIAKKNYLGNTAKLVFRLD